MKMEWIATGDGKLKLACGVLGVLVALLSALLAFSVQYNQFFLKPLPVEEEIVEPVEPVKVSEVLVSPQLGLAEELMSALKKSQDELNVAKLEASKRDQDSEALQVSYLNLLKEARALIIELEGSLVEASAGEGKNFKRLAGVYSKMDASASAEALKHMEPERVARILTLMEPRAMASVMNEAASASAQGSEVVAEWSEAIRLMAEDKKE